MPRTPKKSQADSSTPIKPYSTSSDDKPDLKSSTSTPGKGTVWTGPELLLLFEFAMNRNERSWELAAPGRTANQARQTWTKTILPLLQKTLLDRGGA